MEEEESEAADAAAAEHIADRLMLTDVSAANGIAVATTTTALLSS